ncbi:MAG: hypothetical protein ACI8TX_000065 [Hyphomicrobiaceae bacterium]|jgi:hypothetical protein
METETGRFFVAMVAFAGGNAWVVKAALAGKFA